MLLALEASGIAGTADTFFEDDLADANSRTNGKRDGASVVHLQHLARTDHARLDEVGGHMHHEPDTGKPAASLDPATDVVWQRESFFGDAEHCLAWEEEQVVVNGHELGDLTVIGVLGHMENFPGMAEEAELTAEVEIDRGRTDL